MSQPGMADPATSLDWTAEGVPISRRFEDPYFSLSDGLAETRHVFLAGNDLPGRFRPGFAVAELGFGTGLNLLTLWDAWDRAGIPGTLFFTSFELSPLAPEDMGRALAAFPELGPRCDALLAAMAGGSLRFALGPVAVEIVPGDARATLPQWTCAVDAWFLDGFAPARNPEMWEPALLAEVAGHSRPGATLATYTAAGHVRRALEAAGFAIARAPGYGRKRHMTCGILP
jgi:tRNA U34 5-methylaminomethyl-2-thiouridine-forming methyltransferase MnmC